MAATKYRRAHPQKWAGVYVYELHDRKADDKIDVCYVITYKAAGKKRWEKVGLKSEGYTPEVAAEIRAQRVKADRHGEEVKTAREIREDRHKKNRTVDEVAELYFAERLKARWGHLDKYKYDMHVAPAVGMKSAPAISELDLQRMRDDMKGKGLKPATIWGALEILRRVVNYGWKHGFCPPLRFTIQMPERDNIKVEYLTPEQAAKFLEVLDAWPHPDIPRALKLAMFTGMRRGEIFKLEDRDLDFRQELIRLREPKGGKTVHIPMNSIARQILQDQMAWRDEKHPGSPFVFPGRFGGQRVDASAVDRIAKAADLPEGFRIFHSLRHHYAVTLANSGEVSIDMLATLLTHKDPKLTRERYGQFLPGTIREAGNLAAELIQAQAGMAAKSEKKNVLNIK